MPEITPDLSDKGRCISVHWTLPVQCVLPRSHRENWHETWDPETGNRLRYRYGIYRTEELRNDEWAALFIPPPVTDSDVVAEKEFPGELLNARVQFWMCINPEHEFVTWDGDVATCPDCGITSEMTKKYAARVERQVREQAAMEIDALMVEQQQIIDSYDMETGEVPPGGPFIRVHAYEKAAATVRGAS